MSKSVDHSRDRRIAKLQETIRLLEKRLEQQKDLESRLNETLHNLQVHEEELRTQNDDLIAAQSEIAQSHRKYVNLFDFAPIGYFLLDIHGVIQEVNLTGADMIERQRSVICGKPLLVYIQPAYRQPFFRHLRKIWEGRSASIEVVLLKAKEDPLPVEFFSMPVEDEHGRINQCRIAATDISKRWEAEEALRESQRKLDSIVKNIPDIVYRLDPSGMINFISEGICRYGYNPVELMGKSIMRLVHPQDHPIARFRINERRTGARSTHGLEIRLVPKKERRPEAPEAAQEDRYFLVNAEGLYTNSENTPGEFIGTQGIAHDITNRKESEIERMRLEAELQKARKMEAIGTLAGGIAHDFNNLLMGIQGNASLMRMDLSDAGENNHRIENIEQCVKRGSELTQQLLGFAKGGKFNVQTIDVNSVVADTARMFGRTRKAIYIRQRLAPDLHPVDADRGQVEQVLLNLLINADHAMPSGGRIDLITENVEFDPQHVRRLDLPPQKYISIVVEDTGIGMDEQTRNRIFEPFFTTKEMGHGTGLGLASAYGIIKNHGGMIDVVSTPGQGSRFTVCLPASNGRVIDPAKAAPGIAKGIGTILLVDDEKLVIDVGRQMLLNLGYQVISATSGDQAIEIYAQRHEEIDMVVLDMVMPEMSGFETYGRLKKINPAIKVLLSSGYSKDGQASEVVARDKQSFIQKPFDLAQLSQAVATLLAKP
jgi:two-component system cell cycle sensor histidine kinase/response regulator CckA